MAQLLESQGLTAELDPGSAEVILVNTCGFIEPAREESYEVLAGLSAGKKPGQKLIAAGCLTQRYGGEVLQRVPGIDGLLGTRRWMDIVKVFNNLRSGDYPGPVYHLPDDRTVGKTPTSTVGAHIEGGSAYLKIADGCRRPCAFCAIPGIKGTRVSRPRARIISDARYLASQGVKEINLIAQDTTDYGHDLGLQDGLADLLRHLCPAVPEVEWVRIMYAYPGYVTDQLIDVMAEYDQILPYLDMPLQHADPAVLKKMRRPANLDWVHQTVAKLRVKLPQLALRTTFIVGYPGETDQAFENLLDFVEEIRFDRIGVFEYSFEPGTAAEVLGDPVPGEVKTSRLEQIMLKQQGISLEKNQALIGSTLDVLIEGGGAVEGTGESISLGRSYRDAPEIDGLVIVEGALPAGEIIPVMINGAMAYDLSGVPKNTNQNILETAK